MNHNHAMSEPHRVQIGPELVKHLQPYQIPEVVKSITQMATSILPLVGLLVAMHFAYQVSYPLVLLLSIVAAVFVIRVFIIQHDCGHGSFFSSRWANATVGWLCSVLTFFPYGYWRHQHAMHHAANGKLEERGSGDVYLMTVSEYIKASPFERLKYRLIRNPWTLFVFGPFVLFFVLNRFVYDRKNTPEDVIRSLYASNALIVLTLVAGFLSVGMAETFGIILPVVFFSGLLGTILFYVQHQFEETYFKSGKNWNYFEAAVHGSSFFDLPRFLHWCTGNIGFHHVHHLAPKIPNYKLQECHEAFECFSVVKRETLGSFMKTFKLAFWDEDQDRLIGLRELKDRYASKL